MFWNLWEINMKTVCLSHVLHWNVLLHHIDFKKNNFTIIHEVKIFISYTWSMNAGILRQTACSKEIDSIFIKTLSLWRKNQTCSINHYPEHQKRMLFYKCSSTFWTIRDDKSLVNKKTSKDSLNLCNFLLHENSIPFLSVLYPVDCVIN